MSKWNHPVASIRDVLFWEKARGETGGGWETTELVPTQGPFGKMVLFILHFDSESQPQFCSKERRGKEKSKPKWENSGVQPNTQQ